VHSVSDRTIPSIDGPPIPVRIYRPSPAAGLPIVVWFHGGGWVLGNLETHDQLCRELCDGVRAIVVSVDYRLAPEARFPAAVDDCAAAWAWVNAHAQELGGDPDRIALGGDSAGGNLAAVVALTLKKRLAFQLLIYPCVDQRMATDSIQRNGQGYLLTRALMGRFRANYLPNEKDKLDWRASPLLATSLSGLPQAFLLTAGFDPLVDVGRAYAERLAREGVEVEYRDYPDMIHGFIVMGGVLDTANEAVADCCAALRRAFEKVNV
jgi:acetyl esterase